ncbi:hypothetical protein ASPCADRAFT_207715, partial [Aspergillus carbonarius ITEM 5010]
GPWIYLKCDFVWAYGPNFPMPNEDMIIEQPFVMVVQTLLCYPVVSRLNPTTRRRLVSKGRTPAARACTLQGADRTIQGR